MAEEPEKPFELKPGLLTAILMCVTALVLDALQFFLGSALTVIVGGGLLVGYLFAIFSPILFFIWFKLADNNNETHVIGSRVLKRIFLSALTFGLEFIPGLDLFVPGILAGVMANIFISWSGDLRANRLAKREAEGKEQKSFKDEKRLARRWEGVDPETRARQEGNLQEKARDDAKPGKDQRQLVRRQTEREKDKEKYIGMKAPGIATLFGPEAALPLAASKLALNAYLRDKEKGKKGAIRPGSPPVRKDPYTENVQEAA